jgi:hypothetical protein
MTVELNEIERGNHKRIKQYLDSNRIREAINRYQKNVHDIRANFTVKPLLSHFQLGTLSNISQAGSRGGYETLSFNRSRASCLIELQNLNYPSGRGSIAFRCQFSHSVSDKAKLRFDPIR